MKEYFMTRYYLMEYVWSYPAQYLLALDDVQWIYTVVLILTNSRDHIPRFVVPSGVKTLSLYFIHGCCFQFYLKTVQSEKKEKFIFYVVVRCQIFLLAQ